MAFQKFVETARSYRPKVSIRKTGTISFNSGAINKFDLKKYKYVLLFFDAETRNVGIKPVLNAEDGAHRINQGKVSVWVSAKRFFDFFGIPIEKTIRYDASWDQEDGMIVFQLT